VTIDYAGAGRLLDAFSRAWHDFDGDAWVGLFTEDARYHGDPFSPPIEGHLGLRALLVESAEAQEDVEFTVERHWVAGDTVLAAWHASYRRRGTPDRVRIAGFMTMEVAADGRIDRLHEWSMTRPPNASGQEGNG
jgi:ketosteroid isomerase-like protein